ncbi:hypothetical protein [Kitasatospora cineracea]|uniref:hypothetical protein n=1 Tax=Kitasatospora cineracea TaxID=88074 RepID=UPI0036868F4A
MTDTVRTAYEAYATITGGLNHLGRPMPTWDTLPELQRAAWAAAVAAVLPATVPDGLDANPNAIHGYTDGCPSCPDGHRPSASGTWGAHILQPEPGSYPMTVIVQRPAGEHVSDADAEWIRTRLNAPS